MISNDNTPENTPVPEQNTPVPVQNTPEWLEWRRSRIGASDAAAILGVSQWDSAFDLWQRKLGIIPEQEKNSSMLRGIELESQARKIVEDEFGIDLPAVVKEHYNPEMKWMIASLDGWNEKDQIALEIKCPGKSDHQCALDGKVPPKYIPQVQHQLEVIGMDTMYYVSFDGFSCTYVRVDRDQKYIDRLITKELEFLECMRSFVAPPLTDRDYQNLEGDNEWVQLVTQWKNCRALMNSYTDLESQLRTQLIDKSNGRSSYGAGVSVIKSMKKGTLPLSEIFHALGRDPQDFEHLRNKPSSYWQIREDKQ